MQILHKVHVYEQVFVVIDVILDVDFFGNSRLGESYATLYWSLFGITAKHDLKIQNSQTFTEILGRLMFMLYHCMAIIVLINMLIAMMSNSFQTIEVLIASMQRETTL